MSKATMVVFMVDDEFSSLYFTTPENYSLILDEHNITPDRVKFTTILLESIMLILDNQKKYIVK